MTDPDIFKGWEERMGSCKPLVWCKCGHVEGTHLSKSASPLVDEIGDDGAWTYVGFAVDVECHYGSGRKACKCIQFRPKKRKNRIKFWLTGRG